MYWIKKINAHHVVDFAAEELKKYLRMMMPRCGEIDIVYDPNATDGFRLGLMSDFGLDTSEAADIELDDILHIDCNTEGGIIAGSNPRSVLLAVYRYLTLNGCRWLFPGIDGEFIPVKNIEAVQYHKMADCRYRGQCNEGAESQPVMMAAIDFAPKIGMNVFMMEHDIPYCYYRHYYNHERNETHRIPEPVTYETVLQWKRQCEVELAKRGLQFHDMGHGWTSAAFKLDPIHNWSKTPSLDMVDEENRQYLALVNGKRDFDIGYPLNTSFCMSNEKARQNVVDAVVEHAEKGMNVDFLHVWLADHSNNHCECEHCVKMLPSDWYVLLLNEIDAALTARKLNTRIVFICYTDTTWVPEKLTLHNPSRFKFLVAAISRNHSEWVSPHIEPKVLRPYVRNKNKMPDTVDEYLLHAAQWRERCQTEMFIYEYHFWRSTLRDVGLFDAAQGIMADIRGYRANGASGIIEDGTQRAYFPNGFLYTVYAATLFDNNVDFEQLKADYFSHAYGEDWQEVTRFFEELGEALPYRYLHGKMSSDESIGKYYHPALSNKIRRVPRIVERFLPFVEAHKTRPYRAQSVAYRMLFRYLEFVRGYAGACVLKANGCDLEAYDAYLSFMNDFGKYELEMELCYDHQIAALSVGSVFGKRESFIMDMDET